MGNLLTAPEQEDEDEIKFVPTKDKVYDIKKIYWDIDGNLRYGVSDKNRDEEVLELLQLDNLDESDPDKIWMIIPSRWVRKWLLFAHLKAGPEPGKITMDSLVVRDTTFVPPNWDQYSMPFGWRPKNTLKPPYQGVSKSDSHPGHYRRVPIEVWTKLAKTYGVQGFPIAVRGVPYDEVSRWRLFKTTDDVRKEKLPEAEIKAEKDDKATKPAETKKSIMSSLTSGFGSMFGGGSKTNNNKE